MSNVAKQTRWKLSLLKDPRISFGIFVLVFVLFCAVFAPFLAPYKPTFVDMTLRLAPPSNTHWLGVDTNGNDVLTSMLYGSRTTLFVATMTVLLSLLLGVTIGTIAGYAGKWTDSLLMRTVDILMAFPGILLALTLVSVLGPSLWSVIISISATGWTSAARIARAQVMSVKERDHVMATRALGGGPLRLIRVHILPLIWTPIVVHATFAISGVIIVEASLSFLGLGPQDGAPTWGALLNQGRSVLEEAPHLSIVPGLAIMAVVLSLNFLGDALRDILDPHSQSSR